MLLKQRLRVLTPTEAKTKGVIDRANPGPIISGGGEIDYLCGKCHNVIAESITKQHLENMVNAAFKCNKCGKINAL